MPKHHRPSADLHKPTAQGDAPPAEEIIVSLFLIVDEQLGSIKKRSDAGLYASEIVTVGLVFALKGGRYRAFSRWLAASDRAWPLRLPDSSRLHRLLHG